MKIALLQLKATDNKEKNIQQAVRLVEKAVKKKVQFILLPEIFNYRGKIKSIKDLGKVVEKIPGKSIKPFLEIAQKQKVYILAGSIYEKTDKQKAYNTSVLISPKGEIIGKYRKQNLFSAKLGEQDIDESRRFLRGKKQSLVKVQNFLVGLSICYDLRFPLFYQRYAQKGAHILCIPSAFTRETGKAHWEVLCRARAIENQCYVLAVNQFGKDNRNIYDYGNSLIIDPWGKVIARASADKEEILLATLDMEKIKKIKKCLPMKKGDE
jgi:predicted amidohydrolase